MTKQQLDKFDITILKLLSGNARKPYLEISRECGVSGAAVHQRIQRLNAAGVILGSESIINPSAIGYDTCSYVGVMLRDPSLNDRMVAKLQSMPEVVECYFTSGHYDIFIKVFARNNDHLLHLLQEIQELGWARTETLICFKQVFKRQLPVDADR